MRVAFYDPKGGANPGSIQGAIICIDGDRRCRREKRNEVGSDPFAGRTTPTACAGALPSASGHLLARRTGRGVVMPPILSR